MYYKNVPEFVQGLLSDPEVQEHITLHHRDQYEVSGQEDFRSGLAIYLKSNYDKQYQYTLEQALDMIKQFIYDAKLTLRQTRPKRRVDLSLDTTQQEKSMIIENRQYQVIRKNVHHSADRR